MAVSTVTDTVVGAALPNTTFMVTVTITEFLYLNLHNSGHTFFCNKSIRCAKNKNMALKLLLYL